MLKAGIIGLPNVGKSTLFNALVENAKAQAANFPFCTIEPNKGIVSVPDQRLQELGNLSSSQNIIPTKIEFVDIAGLVKGASKGEGLGNKFLSNIREVDAIVHVVRCFEDSDVIHVSGKVDPLDDIEIINLELNLADLSQLQKRRERIKKQVRTSKEAAKEDTLLEKIAYVCNIVTGFALIVMTVIFSWLVYGRYVLNSTPTWVEQVSLLLVVLIGFLGAAIGIHKRTHLGVSYFRDRMPIVLKIIFDLTTHFMLMIFGYVMMVYSYKLVVFKWSTQIPLIHIPEGLRAVPIMICGGLILLFSIGHLLNYKGTITKNIKPK